MTGKNRILWYEPTDDGYQESHIVPCAHIARSGAWRGPSTQLHIDVQDGQLNLHICQKCAAMVQGIVLQDVLNTMLARVAIG